MIKNLMIFISLIFGLNTFSYSQDSDTIKDIRQKFRYINKISNYKTISLENEEFLEQMTDGGGILTAYLKNDSIYKMHEKVGLSFGVVTTEYYYWNEKLIFAYQIEEVFNHIFHMADTVEIDMSPDEAYKLVKTTEKRFYFKNDKLIDLKIQGESFFGEDDENNKAIDLIDRAKNYLKILKSKN